MRLLAMRICILTVCCLLIVSLPCHAQTNPPNIVFILADDLGVNDLSCYGRTDQATPHLDQLAKDGIRFTSAYAAQSVCSPTRAAIMTGQTPARLHLTTFLPGRTDAPAQMLLHPKINQGLPEGTATLATHLQKAGYATAAIGKWHLGGSPTKFGFDFSHAGKANTVPSATEGGKGEFDLTTQAEAFLDKNQAKPFFLYLCHNNPHITLAAQPDRIQKFKSSFNPLYAAVINTLDESVGRITRKLDALGLREKTIVIFTSDNGGLHVLEGGTVPTHNTPFRAGKGFLYEGGLRIPLLVRWPGKVEPGQVNDTPVISTDWSPTLLAATGQPALPQTDGVNLMPLLSGEKLAPRSLYWHQPHYMNQGSRPSGAMREASWKLIEHYENGACELYDLAHDIGEQIDLSDRHPDKVASMRGKLEKWRRDVGAQSNLPNPAFNYAQWRSCFVQLDVSGWPTDKLASDTADKMKTWRQAMNNVLKKENLIAGQGCIILNAIDAKLHGEKLRHEPEPHKDTIGYWANQNDWAEWKVSIKNPGTYAVELLQAAGKGSGGAEVEVSLAGQTLIHKVKETGHFQRFVPLGIGQVRLEPGEYTLTIKARTKPGFGVMDLRRVVLRGVK